MPIILAPCLAYLGIEANAVPKSRTLEALARHWLTPAGTQLIRWFCVGVVQVRTPTNELCR